MARTFFAYHMTHEFGDFGNGIHYHTDDKNPHEGDYVYVISGDKTPETRTSYFLEGCYEITRRNLGRYPLPARRNQTREFAVQLELKVLSRPPMPISLDADTGFDTMQIRNYVASGQNFNPLPPGYLAKFEHQLSSFAVASNDEERSADIAEIENREDIPPTQKLALIQARVGQGKFRRDLIEVWGGEVKCALTGIDLPELLIASHIKPWRASTDAERLDGCNGLLLAAHVDKLFDRYLLTFKSNSRGELVTDINQRARPAASQLGIEVGCVLARRTTFANQDKVRRYLGGHQELFESKANRRA